MPASDSTVADPDWWRGAVIYQIYPRSFFDSNGDGVGDLAGIETKLSAVAALGVDAVWISPFFKSPMKDFGYDVSDYRDVDPLFGNLDDFKRLLAAAHALGLRVIIDLVLSHTSDQHPWFVESRRDHQNPKADWYVWADATDCGNPPNNWLSLFGGAAWEWDAARGQYYMHNFLVSQPDLNFHNREVQEAVLDTARFWLDLGVDGFRLDVVNFFFHDAQLRDNPPAPTDFAARMVDMSNPYAFQDHVYDKHRPENLPFLERFRALLDEYPGSTTLGELGVDRDVPAESENYTLAGRRLHQVYNFDLMTSEVSASGLAEIIRAMAAGLTSGWVAWAMSNHDFPRVISRWGFAEHRAEAAPMLIALLASLRGSPCLYQGEELGLGQAYIPYEQIRDPYALAFWPNFKGRDGCRTPYPWRHDAPFGGFSTATPWLPAPVEHLLIAFDLQVADPGSPLNRVRRFLHWRRTVPALWRGDIEVVDTAAPLLAFRRRLGDEAILCVFNLGGEAAAFRAPGGENLEPLNESGFEAASLASVFAISPLSALFCKVSAHPPA